MARQGESDQPGPNPSRIPRKAALFCCMVYGICLECRVIGIVWGRAALLEYVFSVPEGRDENSPPIHRWEKEHQYES